jgi:hypothetical protein
MNQMPIKGSFCIVKLLWKEVDKISFLKKETFLKNLSHQFTGLIVIAFLNK